MGTDARGGVRRWLRQPQAWMAGVWGAWALLSCAAAGAEPLNDTGVSQCVQPGAVPFAPADCAGSGQDGESGRDARLPAPGNGVAGFAFVKIGAQGERLPPRAPSWRCVLDLNTGLLWERKTDDGGLHDRDSRYTNWGDGRGLDASWFAALVNDRGLCGHQDWRLPTHLELHGLMHLGSSASVALDGGYFADTPAYHYWASTGVADYPGEAWAAYFGTGQVQGGGSRANYLRVRLVRSDAAPAAPALLPTGAKVLMDGWRRLWQRCTAGQQWRHGSCQGTAQLMTWPQALDYARAEAERTGQPWRLPNVKELVALIDPARAQPALDRQAFPGAPALRHWTSTPAASGAHVWTVDFSFGGADLRGADEAFAVRLIRGGP